MIEIAKIKDILIRHYNIGNAGVKKLDGYENENFLIVSKGKKFVLKTYRYSESLYNLVQAEREILLQLGKIGDYTHPKPIKSIRERFEIVHNCNGRLFIIRILSFVKGESLCCAAQTNMLFRSLGKFLARMDSRLMKIDNAVIRSRKSEWNIVYFEKNRSLLRYIYKEEDKKLLESVFEDYESVVKPALHSLRHFIIHNDANDYNVLTDGKSVTGIIDFGDLAYAPLIAELGVAIAYAGFGKQDPVSPAKTIIQEYSKIIPLEKKELDVLYHIITARLTTTIVNAAYARITNPSNQYTYTSEKDAWRALRLWVEAGDKVFSPHYSSTLGF